MNRVRVNLPYVVIENDLHYAVFEDEPGAGKPSLCCIEDGQGAGMIRY